LVSETVVVDKKNTSVGCVFDIFVIPICSDYLEEKKQNERTIASGYLKNFRIKRITGLGYFIKKKQNHIIIKEPEWEMQRIGWGGSTG
jgi:hypothetical protein